MRVPVLAGLLATSLWSPSASGAQEPPIAPVPPTVVDDGPTETGVVSGRPHPESATEAGSRPVFQLPFRWDELWQAGSPHGTNHSALDFGPRRIGGNDDVVAAAAGTVQRVTCSGGSYPRVDHGNGWVSFYYHAINVNWSLVGRRVWPEPGWPMPARPPRAGGVRRSRTCTSPSSTTADPSPQTACRWAATPSTPPVPTTTGTGPRTATGRPW